MRRERKAAQKLSIQIDRLLARPNHVEDETAVPISQEMAAARHLHQWSQGLPPVPEGLKRHVAALVRSPRTDGYPRTWRSAAWGALATAAVLVAIWMVVPSGQQVWAQVWRVLLGQTKVELTPTLEPPTRAVRQPLRDLVAAELVMGRAPSLPRELPRGYVLIEIAAVSYPDLPSWISQPFFVELGYGPANGSPELRLREYRLLFREYGRITGVEAASGHLSSHQEVDVAGVRGVLLTFSGDEVLHALIWERDGLLLELETAYLAKEELLRTAQSVR